MKTSLESGMLSTTCSVNEIGNKYVDRERFWDAAAVGFDVVVDDDDDDYDGKKMSIVIW